MVRPHPEMPRLGFSQLLPYGNTEVRLLWFACILSIFNVGI